MRTRLPSNENVCVQGLTMSKVGRLRWKFEPDLFPLYKLAEAEGTPGLVGDGHRDQRAGEAPAPGAAPAGWAQQAEGRGGRQQKQHRAGLVPTPYLFPSFCFFPFISEVQQRNSSMAPAEASSASIPKSKGH